LAAVAAHGPLSPRATLATGAAVALLVACALGAATRARAALWGDVVELWGDACQKDPGEFRPHANYGQLLQLRGDAAGAAREYEIALRLDPNLALSVRQLTPNYAYALLDLGRVAEAAAILDRRLAWNSGDPGAVAARARVFLAEGRPTQAEALLREHFVAEPALLGALGAAVEAQGRLGEAEAAYLRAVRMDPTNAEYRADRARVLARLGRLPEACYSLLEARRAIESRDVARLANVAASIGCK
jgi:tetratricopeptide (TPR) repeat protein